MSDINNSDVLRDYRIAEDHTFIEAFGDFNVTKLTDDDEDQLQRLSEVSDGVTPEDLILIAQLHSRKINVSEEFETFSSPLFGKCFTFNVVKEDGTGGNVTLSQGQSLKLIMNISQGLYFPPKAFAGIDMFIHDPNDRPSVSDLVVGMPPGFSTTVYLTPTEYKFLSMPYKSYGDGSCVTSLNTPAADGLLWHKRYTQSACIEECVIRNAIDKCGCRPNLNGIPEFLSEHVCSKEKALNCIYPNSIGIMNHVQNKNSTLCDCPTPCEFIQYDVRTSQKVFPTSPVADFLIKHGHATSYQTLRDNYVRVVVRFERMMLQHVQHVPELTSRDILSQVGGHMGIFLGASLLTLTELAETIIMLLVAFCQSLLSRISPKKVGTKE